MRRPPIVCRRAVHSLQPHALQHAWVPDHVLSLALDRFFRILCPHQKRNGSSVPGPLEAKRRAAKRRMTMSASFYPHDSFSPPISLASLFGFRSSPRPAWRYEPPSLPRNTESLDQSSEPPRPPSALNQPHPPQVSSITNHPTQSVTPLSSSPDITQNVVSEPEAALTSAAHMENTKVASATVDASPSLTTGLVNDEHKITLMVARAIETEQSLVSTSKKKLRSRVPAITAALGGEKAPGHQFFTNTNAASMDAWLRLLHRLDSKLESDLPNVSLIDTALVPLTRLTFTKKISPDALIKAMLMILAHKGALQGVSIDRIFDLVTACEPLPKKGKGSNSSPIDRLLERVVLQMHVESLPYDSLLELSLPLIARYARMDSILKLLNKMEDQNLPLHDRAFIDKLVEEKISIAQHPNNNLTEKRRQQNIYNLRICKFIHAAITRMHTSAPDKEEKLIEVEAQRRFQHILNRAKDKRAFPLVYQNLPADMSPEQRTKLVHQLARHYSLDKSQSYLAAWRTIYFLYRYLLLFSLPIGPLFTQAVIQVSLARPLAEKRFVSARRLIWVCHLVAKVEGSDAARKVEKEFWHCRGEVIKHAKHAYVSAGGRQQDKAHIGTMKKLGLI